MEAVVIIIIIALCCGGWWRVRRFKDRMKNTFTCSNGFCRECVHMRQANSRTSPTGYICLLQRDENWNKIRPDDWNSCCERPRTNK
jgi:DNA-binding transcriptional regulator of glucitol operon